MESDGVYRVNKYLIEVDGVSLRATPDQEARLRAMSKEERVRFIEIMTGG